MFCPNCWGVSNVERRSFKFRIEKLKARAGMIVTIGQAKTRLSQLIAASPPEHSRPNVAG
jgi:Na+-transporting methylmalonyl-CoA/oxaloacetate decarboxylase gamma subunit